MYIICNEGQGFCQCLVAEKKSSLEYETTSLQEYGSNLFYLTPKNPKQTFSLSL